MCLNIDKEITNRLLAGPEKFRVWKTLWWDGENFRSVYKDYEWKFGENVAEGEVIKLWEEVYGGCFHVYLDKKRAKSMCDTSHLLAELEVDKKDLVAGGTFCGDESACFKKVTLISVNVR